MDDCVDVDEIDAFVARLQRGSPDLDLSTLATFLRLKQFSRELGHRMERVVVRHGLNPGEFDVLTALRHTGPPYSLMPSQLSTALTVSRAGMTNRIDRLEAAGLVARALDIADRRSVRVALTDKGRAVIDAALAEHTQVICDLSACLSADQRCVLDDALGVLLQAVQRLPPLCAPPVVASGGD
jgi:DNA-binding MarR family transcriptional regulator